MALRALAVALVCAALLAPAAQAHTSVVSGDGKYRAVVGLLDEPVVTSQKTGLDVCFTLNDTARTPLPLGNLNDVTAQLQAPDGSTLNGTLAGQFGRSGCYQFAQPFVLTQPGQYVVHLTGALNKTATQSGTPIAFRSVAAGGAVQDAAGLTFPDTGVPSTLALQSTIDALEARIAQLEAGARADDAAAADEEGQFAPGAPAALLMVGLAALAAVRRMR